MHTANGQIETLCFHWCSPCRPRHRLTMCMHRPRWTVTLIQSLSCAERGFLYTDDTRPMALRQGHLMLSPGGALCLWADEEDDTQGRQGQFHGIRPSMLEYGHRFDCSHIPKTLPLIDVRIAVQGLTPHATVWHPHPVVPAWYRCEITRHQHRGRVGMPLPHKAQN